VLSHEPAETATDGKAGNAGGGDQAARGRQTKGLRLTVKLPQGHSALGTDCAPAWVDWDAFHGREIDDHAAVHERSPCQIVPAAMDGYEDVMRTGKVDGGHNVDASGTVDDQCRVLIDQRVVVPPGEIMPLVTWTQHPAAQTGCKFPDDRIVQSRRSNRLHLRRSSRGAAVPPG